MNLISIFKNNTVKVVIGSAGSIAAIVGGLFTIDARYAHAQDVVQYQRDTKQIIKETTNTLRQQMLEDKLFELDIKKAQDKKQQLTPIDSAMYNRYKQQLNDIKRSQ